MAFIGNYGARRRTGGASLALECRSGSGQWEIHFEVFDDVRRNVLTLAVMARQPIAQYSPQPPEVPSDRTAWSFHLSRQTLALAGSGDTFGDPGILFWGAMRVEFHPVTPTAMQAEVMREYVLLWPRLFGTHPPPSVEFDLIQMGIHGVHFPPARRRQAPETAGLLRELRSRSEGMFFGGEDMDCNPPQALAPPNPTLPVYRPKG